MTRDDWYELSLEVERAAERTGIKMAPAEHLERRQADRRLLRRLQAQGFTGPEYEYFVQALCRTGTPILMAWMRSGRIFELCARKGRPLQTSESARHVLRTSFDDRQALADETVTEGLVLFRTKVLLAGTWREEGGASVLTYFVGALLLSFKTPYRRWHKQHTAWEESRCERYPLIPTESHQYRLSRDAAAVDPADLAILNAEIAQCLAAIKDETNRKIFKMLLLDLTYAEIARGLSLTEGAVTMRVSRMRRQLGEIRRPDDDPPLLGRRQP